MSLVINKTAVIDVCKGAASMLLLIVFVFVATTYILDLLGIPEPPIKESSLKDRADLITEVCVKGKLVAVFSVIQKIENMEIHVTQAGYKETYSTVIDSCVNGE